MNVQEMKDQYETLRWLREQFAVRRYFLFRYTGRIKRNRYQGHCPFDNSKDFRAYETGFGSVQICRYCHTVAGVRFGRPEWVAEESKYDNHRTPPHPCHRLHHIAGQILDRWTTTLNGRYFWHTIHQYPYEERHPIVWVHRLTADIARQKVAWLNLVIRDIDKALDEYEWHQMSDATF